MKVNNFSYPHPVLGNEDDFSEGFFRVEFSFTQQKNEILFHQTFKLKNNIMESLIKDGRAVYVIEIMCPSTFYRESFSSHNDIEIFKIPSTFLRERVRVSFFICAEQNIENYRPSQCHADYTGMDFSVEKGDVLAFGGTCEFIAEKDFDPLKPPVGSFISIKQGHLHEGPMDIGFEEDKIVVTLSKNNWISYGQVKNIKSAEGIIHASIVCPVITEAIKHIMDNNEEYVEKNWFGRLKNILEAKGYINTAEEPYRAAQKILENPITRCFDGIKSLTDSAEI